MFQWIDSFIIHLSKGYNRLSNFYDLFIFYNEKKKKLFNLYLNFNKNLASIYTSFLAKTKIQNK